MQQAQQAVCKLRTGALVKVAATFGAPVHRDGDVMFLGSIIYSSEIQSIQLLLLQRKKPQNSQFPMAAKVEAITEAVKGWIQFLDSTAG